MVRWQKCESKKKITSIEGEAKKVNGKNVQRLLCKESADYRDNKHKRKPASVDDDQMNNRAAMVRAKNIPTRTINYRKSV